MFLRKLKAFFTKISEWWTWNPPPIVIKPTKREQPKLSILIPFSSKDSTRSLTLKWLLRYWANELPEAEIIIGRSKGRVFCKGKALNHAVRKATGKVYVIMDADAYIEGRIINRCADRILEELDNHLWYVPYRHLYRLNKEITDMILDSDPRLPLRIPCPPPQEFLDTNKDRSKYGHRYGAMCMMFPKEAFEVLGCFDERFKGWGGEDIALLRALDTLWGRHKTAKHSILHLWHPYLGDNWRTRVWQGQKEANPNAKLAHAYHRATGHPRKMRKLVDEGCILVEERRRRRREEGGWQGRHRSNN